MLKFYYEKIRKEPRSFWEIRPRKAHKLPGTVSAEEVLKLVKATDNLKNRSILTLIYACGLRISKVIKFRKADLDWDQKRIFIKAAKGKKDRYVVLPDKLSDLLKEYLKTYPVHYWFVESPDGGPYYARSIQAVFHRSLEKAKSRSLCHCAHASAFLRHPLA